MSTPVISKADAMALVRRRLLAYDPLTALVADRIRTEHARDTTGLVYPLVILHVETGLARYHGALQQLRVDLYGYSNESQDVSDRVYDLAYKALQAERLWDPSGTIRAAGYAREMERPQGGYNPDALAWFSKGTWLVTLAG